MSTENSSDERIISRMMERTGVATDSELAELLGISPQNYHARKKRGTLRPLILAWGIEREEDLNWLVWGGHEQKVNQNGTFGQVADASPPYDLEGMKLGRALEIVTKIMQDGPKDLRRALTAELHYLDKHMDALGEPVARTQTLEDRLSALENALSSATRRAESAEARLRKSGTM